MSEAPWMKFYPRDWRGDQALRAVSLAARGLWIECLCIMHEAKPYGHLLLNGAPVDGDTLARMTGIPVDVVSEHLAELRQAGVLSVTGKGVVFSRRMTKDHARAQKGRKAVNKRWSQASDDVEQSEAPNRSPNRIPITQKPEAREQNKPEPKAQQPIAATAALLDRLLEANGIGTGFREERNPGLVNLAPILGLLKAGFDLDDDIVAAIRAKPNPNVRSWGYFEPQIREFVAKREGVAATPRPTAADRWRGLADWSAERWRPILSYARERQEWLRETYGPAPFEAGCLVPATLLTELDRQFARAA